MTPAQAAQDLLHEMDEARTYCSLIHRAREKAPKPFTSVKYPITDVRINRYFHPEIRAIMADECNIVGYMDIQPIEYEDTIDEKPLYLLLSEGGRTVSISLTTSAWQDELYNQRVERRNIAMTKKNQEISSGKRQ